MPKKLELDIAKLLKEIELKKGKPLNIGTIESATGGRIADKITNIPGCSSFFLGTIVSYGNEIKSRIVGVKETTILMHGAVSDEVASEMAQNGLKQLHLDYCLSTTGIAGPSGATPVKPIGLFYIGLASADSISCAKHVFTGNRETIKEKASNAALLMLKKQLKSDLSAMLECVPVDKHVVTCFLEHNKMILLLRRSGKVSTYKRAWAGVSGYIETDALDQAYTEIREETGLFKDSIKLVTSGNSIEILDESINIRWIVHPFLFHVKDPEKITIDWEHTELKWIKPKDIDRYTTVPGLQKTFKSVI